MLISISGGSLLVDALIATTLWHLDAGSGSHPPHLLSTLSGRRSVSKFGIGVASAMLGCGHVFDLFRRLAEAEGGEMGARE